MRQVCYVSLEPREIRFHDCDSNEAKITAVEQRLSLIEGQLQARSGLTNRERGTLNREAKMLRRWLSPEGDAPPWKPTRRRMAEISNLEKGIRSVRRRKPTKRRCREARRSYREQHELPPIPVRPDYSPQVISVDQLEAIRRVMHACEAKQDWFTKKQQPVNFVLLPNSSLRV